MTSSTVHDAVDNLNQSFHEFKQANNQRITEIEQKNQADPLTTQKVSRLNGCLEKAMDRLTHLESAASRPLVGGTESLMDRKSCDDFLTYIRKGILPLEQKTLTDATGEQGGHLIPSILSERIYSHLGGGSTIRSLARVLKISTSKIDLLLDKGGTQVGWVADNEDREETSTSEFEKHSIPVHEFYARVRASQTLLDDASVNLESWITDKISESFSSTENQAFILGSGEGRPKGFLNCETQEPGEGMWGTIENFTLDEDEESILANTLIDVFHALKPQYLSKATWALSRSSLAKIRKLKDQTGNYLWTPGLQSGQPSMLLGHPVHIADDMPAFTPERSIPFLAFGNFYEGYMIVEHRQMHVLRDPYSAKPYIEFYLTKRVGGDVVNAEAIKLLSSPIVE